MRVAQRCLGVPWNNLALELGRGLAMRAGVGLPPMRGAALIVSLLLALRKRFPRIRWRKLLSGEVPPSGVRGMALWSSAPTRSAPGNL